MKKQRDLIIDFATDICRYATPCGTEGAVAARYAETLETLGIEWEYQEVVEGRPNVIAVIRGDPSYKNFLFNGHLDIAMPYGKWSGDPYKPWVDDGKIYGAGITDMRSGNTAIMAALAELKEMLPEKHGDVIAAFVMHHDTIGLGLKYFLTSCEWKIDAGLCAEPTDSKLQLAHGGAWDWQIELEGITRHQCMIEESVNANMGMLKILQHMNAGILTYTPDPEMPFLPLLNIGIVRGGEGASMAAEKCLIKGDIRFLEGMTVESMKRDLQKIIDDVLPQMPGLRAKLSTAAFQWPYKLDGNDPVSLLFQKAYEEAAGEKVEKTKGLPSGAFITDGADMIRFGIPTVLYGPGHWKTEPDEYVEIADIEKAADVFRIFCQSVVTQKR